MSFLYSEWYYNLADSELSLSPDKRTASQLFYTVAYNPQNRQGSAAPSRDTNSDLKQDSHSPVPKVTVTPSLILVYFINCGVSITSFRDTEEKLFL